MSKEKSPNTPPTPSGDHPSMTEADTEDFERARKVVELLQEKGIRVLALDFDRTIVDIHTAGVWRQGRDLLVGHVRPCFKALMAAALASPIHVSVVTYSVQQSLIEDVLNTLLPDCNAQRILVRANTKDWLQQGTAGGPTLGKQQHIAWICTEIFNTRHDIVHPEEILLMDDDPENVALAHQFGHNAYEVPENVDFESILNFVSKMQTIHHELLDIEPGKRTSFITEST